MLKFDKAFSVDGLGRGGGLAMLWRMDGVSVMGYSPNHIDLLVVQEVGRPSWRFTGYYGFPKRHRRAEAWEFIRSLNSQCHMSWCIADDFNDMLSLEDKKGRIPHPDWLINGFKEAIDDCNLHEIPLYGKEEKGHPIGFRRGWTG